MRKNLLILLAFLPLVVSARINVQDAFLSMPIQLFPYLNSAERFTALAAVDESNSGVQDVRFDNKTVHVEVEDETLRIQVTEGVGYTIKTNNDTILLIQTLCSPICSSVVQQYTSSWQLIDNVSIPPTAQISENALFVQADIVNGQIVYTDNTPLFLDEEEKKEYLKD